MYCDAACRPKAYRRRVANRSAEASAARATDPVAELLTALEPYGVRLDRGLSQDGRRLRNALHALPPA
ncbi:hypothetical protein GCM10009864_02920 [Streptomyces lunalinharesii]|uniref:Uncharacterized protein n=1 Tax=Streptomyces lunalinharesii TaxID=333384 RepID=A0ABP6DGB1_9ACTN